MPTPQADLFNDFGTITRKGDSIVPPPLPSHRNDPHTSKQAGQEGAEAAKRHRAAILVALKLYGSQTAHEIAARLGLEYVQVAKRCTELDRDGQIGRHRLGFQNGRPVWQTRNSPSGHPACVWHLAP